MTVGLVWAILHWKTSSVKICPVFKRTKRVWRHVTELKHILCFSHVLQYCSGMCMVRLALCCNITVPKILIPLIHLTGTVVLESYLVLLHRLDLRFLEGV